MGPVEKSYEPETVRIFTKVLREGDQVIIAGAHQGYFVSVCASLVGDTGLVYGFEPEPENFGLLAERVAGLGNVRIFNCALGDREANAKFYVNSDNDGGHALWDVAVNPNNTKSKENPKVVSVDVKTIDSFFPDGLDRLKLIMLDAEGSEHSIIKGGINTIADSEVPFIICEINNFALSQCQTSQMSLRSYLSMYGFTPYVVNENDVGGVGNDVVMAFIPGTERAVVFNMLFSRRGKV